MTWFRKLLTVSLFPTNMGLAMLVAWWSTQAGLSAPVVLVGLALVTAVIVFSAERFHPEHTQWNRSHGDVQTDVIHTLVSQISVPELTRLFLLTVFVGFADDLHQAWGGTLWPQQWPIVLQLFVAMAISGFGEYWAHRLMHENPWLWRLHATHHSPKRLYFLNASRFHPLDVVLLYTLFFLPLLLLGVPPEVMLLQTVWIMVHGMYQHCNVHLRLGPLNWIFSMAELHRWHHSLKLEEANNNYGNNMLLWDIVFGTVYWPRDRDASADIGISDMPDFPDHWWGQMRSPFSWRHLQQPNQQR